MRNLSNAEYAQLGAELMAELFRGKVIARPVNEGMNGNKMLEHGELFWRCVSTVEGVADYLDTATAKQYAGALTALVASAERLGLGTHDWVPVLDWLQVRIENALTDEEAR